MITPPGHLDAKRPGDRANGSGAGRSEGSEPACRDLRPGPAPEPGPAGPAHSRPSPRSPPYAQLAAGFGIGVTTAYRYVAEAVELLAALAPALLRPARETR
ncbi:hypothetical protein GCM10010238_22180 [Streptomyces griseoviridis]|uniref:Transposase Helix-turn-helix domain-containing protein n=1 Tax=Streptomyces griseoviridis TaxID=45398 RepID=A0A918GFI0_STRGD|nr:hypothetical protein GCM10010238_22180 [Streptomyces niveoruber]